MSERLLARERLAAEGKLAKDVVAVIIGGKVYDLMTPVDAHAPLEVVHDTDPAGLAVIRHSTAHIMADAVQRLFPGTKVTIGPADRRRLLLRFRHADGPFTEEDLAKIEKKCSRSSRRTRRSGARWSSAARARAVREDGRDLQGRDHRANPPR